MSTYGRRFGHSGGIQRRQRKPAETLRRSAVLLRRLEPFVCPERTSGIGAEPFVIPCAVTIPPVAGAHCRDSHRRSEERFMVRSSVLALVASLSLGTLGLTTDAM